MKRKNSRNGWGLRTGDHVSVSGPALRQHGVDPSLFNEYNGFSGNVRNIALDGSITIFDGKNSLVIFAFDKWGERKKSIGLKINGDYMFYYFIDEGFTFWQLAFRFFKNIALSLLKQIKNGKTEKSTKTLQ